jgi:MYXO-CTERM domain-containing protein
MKIKNPRRKPASIAKTRWAAYAAAGAATALAGSQSVEAAIHYSGLLNVEFPPDRDRLKTFPLDQTGDSLVFERLNICYEALFSINGIVSAAFRAQPNYFPYVSKLSFGQNISTGNFSSGFGFMAASRHCLDSTSAFWGGGGIGYVGFRFNNGAGIQYGWARVKMTTGSIKHGFKVLAYAYADPGEPITAGQRPSDEQAPDEGSLGWLAVGAAGLLAWRKRRSRSACYTRPSLPA